MLFRRRFRSTPRSYGEKKLRPARDTEEATKASAKEEKRIARETKKAMKATAKEETRLARETRKAMKATAKEEKQLARGARRLNAKKVRNLANNKKAEIAHDKKEKRATRQVRQAEKKADACRREDCKIRELPSEGEICVDGNNCMFVDNFGARGGGMMEKRTVALCEALKSWAAKNPAYNIVLVFDRVRNVETLRHMMPQNMSLQVAYGETADQFIMAQFDARKSRGEQVPILVTSDRQMIDVQAAFDGKVLSPRVFQRAIGLLVD